MYKNLKHLTIIIPAFNRPNDLKKKLNFWSEIKSINVIVFDGGVKPLKKKFLNKLNNNINYFHFKDESLSMRVFRSVKYIKTKYVVMQCDDEIYYPGGLNDCVAELEKDSKISCCMGDKVIGFRYRKKKLLYYDMYKELERDYIFKSKKNIDRVAENFNSRKTRPSIYSVIRTKHFKKIGLFCKKVDQYNCGDLYEIIFDIILAYYGPIKIIKTFYWFRNKINEGSFIRQDTFNNFWNNDKNNFLKKKLIRDISLSINKSKPKNIGKILEHYSNTDRIYNKIIFIRNCIIDGLKILIPNFCVNFIQKYKQGEKTSLNFHKKITRDGYHLDNSILKKIIIAIN